VLDPSAHPSIPSPRAKIVLDPGVLPRRALTQHHPGKCAVQGDAHAAKKRMPASVRSAYLRYMRSAPSTTTPGIPGAAR
jgi:hypothetical protein